MADVVRQARTLSVQQVRMLSEQSDSVEELLFEKSLRDEGLSRDDFDSKSTTSSRSKSNSNLLALQAWSAEHEFSDAERMTLAAHFVQQLVLEGGTTSRAVPLKYPVTFPPPHSGAMRAAASVRQSGV